MINRASSSEKGNPKILLLGLPTEFGSKFVRSAIEKKFLRTPGPLIRKNGAKISVCQTINEILPFLKAGQMIKQMNSENLF
jgi:hypothetical protein